MRFFIEGGGTLYGTGTKNEWPFSRGLSTTSGQRLSATYTAREAHGKFISNWEYSEVVPERSGRGPGANREYYGSTP
jgi:hypothetical protein